MQTKVGAIYFISLGCAKNLVDSQVMLGMIKLKNFEIVENPLEANIIIINTCSFINDAKEESIATILEMVDHKNGEKSKCEKIVVAGCMPQRYSQELEKEFPEVDLFVGTGEYNKIGELLDQLQQNNLTQRSVVDTPTYIHSDEDPRVNTSPFYTAWLKVSEGCDRKCTFCVIPSIRGKLRSRTVESLIVEAKKLVAGGVRELNLISQDLSMYGSDLDDKKNSLYNLLEGLERIEGLDWIRLLYYYPEDLTDEIMGKIANSNKICNYLDMPLQHFADPVLKKMNRKVTKKIINQKIEKLRLLIPDITLRTSIIVGFPGETEEDFNDLLEEIERAQFNHLGVFRYSDEEGTPASRMKGKIDNDTIDSRYEKCYFLQEDVSQDINLQYLGTTLEVLVEGFHEETNLLLVGRHQGQAPEVDGKVIINDTGNSNIKVGDLIEVQITEVLGFDLVGRKV